MSGMMRNVLAMSMIMLGAQAMNAERFREIEMDGRDKHKKPSTKGKIGSLEVIEHKKLEPKYITKFGEGKKQFFFETEICKVEILADNIKTANKKLVTVEGRNYGIQADRRRQGYEEYPKHRIETPLTQFIKQNQEENICESSDGEIEFPEMNEEQIQIRDEQIAQYVESTKNVK